jgi:hypothetical protein
MKPAIAIAFGFAEFAATAKRAPEVIGAARSRPTRRRARSTALLVGIVGASCLLVAPTVAQAASRTSRAPAVAYSSSSAASSPARLQLAGTIRASSSVSARTEKASPCPSLKRSDLARLFTVSVGAPYNEGSGACGYGIGPNAKLKGPAIETAESDTFLAQLFPSLGPTQYHYYTTMAGRKVIAFKAPGDKASYSQDLGFSVYVLKGTLFCLVDLSLSSNHEVGLGPVTTSGPVELPARQAVGLAKRVVPLCTDLFASS